MMGEGWRQVQLGDVVTAIKGGGTPDKSNPSYWNGDIPWVSVKDLKENVLLTTEDSITEAGLAESSSNAFDANTIVIATRMAVGVTVKLGKRMAINQDLKAIFPSDEVTNDYLYRYLQMSAPKLAALGTGSTVKGITLGDLRRLVVSFPKSHTEQQRITDILSTWDQAIELTSALLAATRKRKHGLMQILLTGKRRFPEFEGQPWRQVRLGDVVSLSKRRFDPRQDDKAHRCIELEHIESKTGRLLGFIESNQQASLKAIFKPGDVLFGKLRPYLRKFATPNFKGVCSTEIWVLQPKMQIVMSSFLYYLIQSDGFMAEAEKSSGSRMPRADWKIVSEYCFLLPRRNEQDRIASMLDLCTQEANALTTKIELLRTERKALMEKLLTGQWGG